MRLRSRVLKNRGSRHLRASITEYLLLLLGCDVHVNLPALEYTPNLRPIE